MRLQFIIYSAKTKVKEEEKLYMEAYLLGKVTYPNFP